MTYAAHGHEPSADSMRERAASAHKPTQRAAETMFGMFFLKNKITSKSRQTKQPLPF